MKVNRRAKTSTASAALVVGKAREAKQARVVVDHVEDLHVASICRPPVVMSACHISLCSSASKRISEEHGRFCGWGTTRPSRRKIRQIVSTEGTRSGPLAGEVVGDCLRDFPH